MGDVSIFTQGRVATTRKREPSELSKALMTNSFSSRRIQASTNGVFKRIVNGEQIGGAVRGSINVIIVNALPKVSRTYYAEKYDPNKEATLPDCWSNLGDRPEENVPNRQSPACDTCPQNIAGSGENGKSRACRYQRRIAVMLEGDDSGDLYQFNVPALSIFGKGTGSSLPFEAYTKFLIANGEDVDGVVTNIAFNDEAESLAFLFTPVRNISDEEYELVRAAQQTPEAQSIVKLTVAQVDGVTKRPVKAAPAKEEEPEPKPAPVKAKPKPVFSDEPDEEEEDEAPAPVVRKAKTPAPATVDEKPDLAAALAEWGDDD